MPSSPPASSSPPGRSSGSSPTAGTSTLVEVVRRDAADEHDDVMGVALGPVADGHLERGRQQPAAGGVGDHHARPLRDGLRSLQLAFREASAIKDAPGAGPGEKFTGPVN